MVKMGVIGVGSMGRNHVRVLVDLPEVEVVGVADSNEENVQEVARKFKLPLYTDYLKFLDEQKPEAIVIAVPTFLHKEVCLAACKRGIHVLVEKPIAMTVEEGQEMISAAEHAGIILGVGHIERFNPAIIELKRRLDEKQLGQIFMIHSQRQSPLPRRIVDVGVGMDLATHELDMMRYLTGSQVQNISAEVAQVTKANAREDIIFGLLRFQSGVIGILNVNWVTPTTVRKISVTGEKGMFIVDYHAQEIVFYENPAAIDINSNIVNWESEKQFAVDAGNMTKYQIVKKEPLKSQLQAFVKAIESGSAAPVTGADGLIALELALDIVEPKKKMSTLTEKIRTEYYNDTNKVNGYTVSHRSIKKIPVSVE